MAKDSGSGGRYSRHTDRELKQDETRQKFIAGQEGRAKPERDAAKGKLREIDAEKRHRGGKSK